MTAIRKAKSAAISFNSRVQNASNTIKRTYVGSQEKDSDKVLQLRCLAGAAISATMVNILTDASSHLVGS